VTERLTPTRGGLFVAAGALLWGTGGVGATIVGSSSEMSYPAVSALRLLIGGCIMLVVTASTGELRRVPRSAAAARHIVATALLTAVFGGTYFEAVSLAGVAVATVIAIGVAPVAVAVVEAVRARRAPSIAVVAAIVLSVVGLVLVSGLLDPAGANGPGLVAAGAGPIVGMGLAAVSGLAFAATTIVNRHVVRGLGPMPLIACAFTLGGAVSLIWGAAAGFRFATMTPTAWGGLLFLSVVQTALGYAFFYAGLHRGVPSTVAAVLTLLEPLAAAVLAVVVLHEALTVQVVAGIVVLLAAVLLVRSPAPPAPAP
jgi:drug/metabolite transporter, DME family